MRCQDGSKCFVPVFTLHCRLVGGCCHRSWKMLTLNLRSEASNIRKCVEINCSAKYCSYVTGRNYVFPAIKVSDGLPTFRMAFVVKDKSTPPKYNPSDIYTYGLLSSITTVDRLCSTVDSIETKFENGTAETSPGKKDEIDQQVCRQQDLFVGHASRRQNVSCIHEDVLRTGTC